MANIFENMMPPDGDPKQRYYKDLNNAEREGFTRAMKAHLKDKYPEMSDADVGKVVQMYHDYQMHKQDAAMPEDEWNAKAQKIMSGLSSVNFGKVGEKDPSGSYDEFFDKFLSGKGKSIIKGYDSGGSWPMPVKAEPGGGNPGNRDDLKVTGKGRGTMSEDRRAGEESDDSQGALTAEQKQGMLSDKDQGAYVGWVIKNPGKSTADWIAAGKPGAAPEMPGATVETAGGKTTPKPRKGGSKMGDSESFLAPAKPQTSPMDLNGSDSPLASPEYMDLLKKKIGTA